MKILPFHKWKDEQVKKDSESKGVILYFRPRHWYWQHYGVYVDKMRKLSPL